ncbi:uncharacterized protein LOC114931793 [Nylanderia fulva]|uniref:uncharacterized protein LOC114931793 n=1 Tax=Nylanderia fulva TaxID=613905 RepID=UPI0010FBA3FC|nr:uncharacterized protein LOC114931793 [Nylanderia fulva]
MVLNKFATVFWRRSSSYRQYYDENINNERVRFPMKNSEESNYDHNIKTETNSRLKDDKRTIFDSSFVFPNDGLQLRNDDDSYIDDMIDSLSQANCDHKMQTFCEDVPNYPAKIVHQALVRNASLLHYANEDVVSKSIKL